MNSDPETIHILKKKVQREEEAGCESDFIYSVTSP